MPRRPARGLQFSDRWADPKSRSRIYTIGVSGSNIGGFLLLGLYLSLYPPSRRCTPHEGTQEAAVFVANSEHDQDERGTWGLVYSRAARGSTLYGRGKDTGPPTSEKKAPVSC